MTAIGLRGLGGIFLREILTDRLRIPPRNGHLLGEILSAACDLEAWELLPEMN